MNFDLMMLLIPSVPALAFMLWVIWALENQIRRDRSYHCAIPLEKARTDLLPAVGATRDQATREQRISVTFAHSQTR
jgi:hypothetical protein